MVKKLVLVVGFVVAVFTGYVVGQTDAKKVPGGPQVLAGENIGFIVDARPGERPYTGRGWVTGKFVVKIDGQWVEARLGAGVTPIGK
jgi:hypothetical protein